MRFLLLVCLLLPVPVVHAKTILVFGDSLSAAYGISQSRGWVALLESRLKTEQPAYRIVNASISGETTSGGLSRFPRALAEHKPAVVILELGANDGLRGLPVAEMKKNLGAMVSRAQAAGAKVLLVGMRLPPNYGPEYTAAFGGAFGEVAKRHRAALLPFLYEGFAENLDYFQPDRIHPNERAQPRMAENVWKTLAPLLGDRQPRRSGA